MTVPNEETVFATLVIVIFPETPTTSTERSLDSAPGRRPAQGAQPKHVEPEPSRTTCDMTPGHRSANTYLRITPEFSGGAPDRRRIAAGRNAGTTVGRVHLMVGPPLQRVVRQQARLVGEPECLPQPHGTGVHVYTTIAIENVVAVQ